jgi:hypothetical protein
MAAYTLTGPNNFRRADSLNFDGSQEIGFLINDVPPGSGYMLTFNASSGSGEVCGGSTSVDVAAQMTATANVTAQCTGAPYVPTGYGSVDVWAALPPSVKFATADIILIGPAGVEDSSSVMVGGTGLHFTLKQVPAGQGQMLSLTAMSSDGHTCTAASTFNVVANQTAETMLSASCS